MRNSKWIVFLLLVSGNVLWIMPCRAQEALTYQSVVTDSLTRKGLAGVHVFAGADSTGVQSKSDGTFRLKVRKGETVRFRKAGYRWLNVEVAEDNAKLLKMVPSTDEEVKVNKTPMSRGSMSDQFEEVAVNGKLLSKEECADINLSYVTGMAVEANRLILTTK
jgi:hypothetical protein